MQRNLKKLIELKWPDDLGTLLQLELPTPTSLARTGYPDLRSIASACLTHSLGLLLGVHDLPADFQLTTSDSEVISGRHLRRRLLGLFLSYYGAAVRQIMTRHLADTVPPALGMDIVNLLHDLAEISLGALSPAARSRFEQRVSAARPHGEGIQSALEWYKKRAEAVDPSLITDQLLTSGYLTFLFTCYIRRRLLSFSERSRPRSQDDRLKFQAIRLYRRVLEADESSERQLATTLTDSAMDALFATYEAPDNQSGPQSPFSNIRVGELPLLAIRHEQMVRQYGAKRLERVFEQQLALVVQSFGMYVVSTRIGERTVDLICISYDPNAHYSFLLEAKTTRRPYSLPTSDSRAIAEYVEEVRRSLTTLPPLMFALIVGPSAANRLEPRLTELEMRAGLPVRFLSANALAQLRARLPGPLQLGDFREHVLMGNRVLPDGLADALTQRYDVAQRQHAELVRTLLSRSRA